MLGSSHTSQLRVDPRALPRLDERQCGHIRHIDNLSRLADGDWSKMGSPEPGQELFGSYRYQLAEMAYALGHAHFHHLPAAPCVFQGPFERLIQKMLRRDVWGYWRDASQSGISLNPDLTELRRGWVDPIIKENIMYSGRLHAMVGMHSMLFDSDKYDEPGALTLHYNPAFFGMGKEEFKYDFTILTNVIYWQLVENGWLGVVCEPNNVFLSCNQFPMLGFRFFDLRNGTGLADEATNCWLQAWDSKNGGLLMGDDFDFIRTWRVQQDQYIAPATLSGNAWTASNLNAWNRELVHELFPHQIKGVLRPRKPDGTISLNPPTIVKAIRQALQEGRPTDDIRDPSYKWTYPDLGFIAMWLSEMGDTENLAGLLAHADKYMNPRWENGGYYYPRNEESYDDEGNLCFMDVLTGNAMLAYARLNVKDGLWKMYNQPWDAAHFANPALTEVSDGVNLSRARFDEDALILSLAPANASPTECLLKIGKLEPRRAWTLFLDGHPVSTSEDARQAPSDFCRVDDGGTTASIRFDLSKPVDVVLQYEP